MKLNIGCGCRLLPGYENLDIVPVPGAVKILSAHSLDQYETDSVDEVLAEHILEHLTFFEANLALQEWHRVLRPGGKLIIECPDLEGLCKAFLRASEYQRYQSNMGHWPLIAHFYGHQRGSTEDERLAQVHKTGYTFDRLKEILKGMGFSSIDSLKPVKMTPGACVTRLSAVKDDTNE
jgi:predicted SAM-dependent methyltransferase